LVFQLIPFRKERLYKENGNEIDGDYPPFISEKTILTNLIKKDIQTFEMKIFGTNKPKLSTLYFVKQYRKFTAELFFAILVKTKILNTNYITETKK
jgi:hypothetical protein